MIWSRTASASATVRSCLASTFFIASATVIGFQRLARRGEEAKGRRGDRGEGETRRRGDAERRDTEKSEGAARRSPTSFFRVAPSPLRPFASASPRLSSPRLSYPFASSPRSGEPTSVLQSLTHTACRLL